MRVYCKAHIINPAVKAKRKAYERLYRQRPAVKLRRKIEKREASARFHAQIKLNRILNRLGPDEQHELMSRISKLDGGFCFNNPQVR